METSKLDLLKIIVGVCAIVMCILFFAAPVVSSGLGGLFSGNSGGYTAFNFGTGSNNAQTFPVAFLLLIFPAILAILAFMKQSFKALCAGSIVCLVGQIIFVSVASNLVSWGEELTGINWVILAIYIGLCIITIVGIKNEDYGYSSNGQSFSEKKCRQCGTIYSGSSICPKCNYSLYEEVTGFSSVNVYKKCPFCANEIKREAIVCQFCHKDLPPDGPVKINTGDTWVCKKCNQRNPITASICKGCGEYK